MIRQAMKEPQTMVVVARSRGDSFGFVRVELLPKGMRLASQVAKVWNWWKAGKMGFVAIGMV